MDRERCRKQAAGRRNALRASEAVRATDVMVNTKGPADIKIVAAPRRGPLLVEMMGFEPMTSELEIRCSTPELQPHLSLTKSSSSSI